MLVLLAMDTSGILCSWLVCGTHGPRHTTKPGLAGLEEETGPAAESWVGSPANRLSRSRSKKTLPGDCPDKSSRRSSLGRGLMCGVQALASGSPRR